MYRYINQIIVSFGTKVSKVFGIFAIVFCLSTFLTFSSHSTFLTLSNVPKAQASMLRQIPLSARLTTSSGNNVTDGSYTMRFRIYDSSSGGSVLWEETKTVSSVSGVFSTLLGSVTSLDSVSFNRDDLYLGIKVGSDDEMTPRKRVAPSPSSLNSDKLDGMDTSTSGGNSVIPITDASGNFNLGSGSITANGGMVTTGNLQAAAGTFSGAVAIQGSATIAGNLTVGGSSVLGTSGSNLSVSSSIVPNASGLNLGSSTSHWASLYVDDLIVGGAGLSSTTAEYYTVNSDATTDQTAGWRVYRGPTVNSYATLQWNTTDTGFRLLSNEGSVTYGKLTMGALTATTGTFTSTVTFPTPFTLGATSVTSTGTQLNYLSSATGTTGTTSTNLVFSTSPTLVTPALGTPTALVLTNATSLPASSVLSGTFGTGAYTMDTSLTVPTVLGGTATTSDLFLKTTSGVGTSGADMHFLVGNNGATEAMTILNSGNVGIGTTAPGAKLDIQGSLASASGTDYAMKLQPTINQSGTAGYVGLLISPTLTAVGNGVNSALTIHIPTALGGQQRYITLEEYWGGPFSFIGGFGGGQHYPDPFSFIGSGLAIETISGSEGQDLDIVAARALRLGWRNTAHWATGMYIQGTVNNSFANAITMNPTINQSGTAGYTALLVNATETATGSGAKLLQDWQVGGVSKAVITNAGNVGIGTTSPTSRLHVDGNSITTTQALFSRMFVDNTNAITTNTGNTDVYGLQIDEPNITVGTATPTNSASLYISGAATEATNNYALFVDAGNVRFDGAVIYANTGTTIADSGGVGAATATITPTASYIEITCNDADGCNVTMGETGIAQGQRVTFVNISANTVNFADTAGVSELNAAFAAGQYDSIEMVYMGDRWIETARSNN